MEKRRHFTPEEKAKIVIEVLREEKTLNEIAAEYEIHPNQLSRWKAEFLNNAARAFSKEAEEVDVVCGCNIVTKASSLLVTII